MGEQLNILPNIEVVDLFCGIGGLSLKLRLVTTLMAHANMHTKQIQKLHSITGILKR